MRYLARGQRNVRKGRRGPVRRAGPLWESPIDALVDLDAAAELLVLVADELDQLLVGQVALIDPHRPWLGVRLGVLDRHVDLQAAEVQAAEALGDLGLAAVRAAVDVQP